MDALLRLIFPHQRKTLETEVGSEVAEAETSEGEEVISVGEAEEEADLEEEEAGSEEEEEVTVYFRVTVIYLVYLGRGGGRGGGRESILTENDKAAKKGTIVNFEGTRKKL